MSDLEQTIGGLRWVLEITEQRGLSKVSVEVEELRTIIAALEDCRYLTEKLHTLSLNLSEVREDRERLRAASESACEYIEGGFPKTAALTLRAALALTLRAALEGRDG